MHGKAVVFGTITFSMLVFFTGLFLSSCFSKEVRVRSLDDLKIFIHNVLKKTTFVERALVPCCGSHCGFGCSINVHLFPELRRYMVVPKQSGEVYDHGKDIAEFHKVCEDFKNSLKKDPRIRNDHTVTSVSTAMNDIGV